MSDSPKSTFARRAQLRPRPHDARAQAIATLGNADALTIPEARAEARRLIASFADTAKKDSGPRTPGRPVEAFAAEFLDRQARH